MTWNVTRRRYRMVFYIGVLLPVYLILGNDATVMLFAGFLIGEGIGELV